jgi:hypothetical protein
MPLALPTVSHRPPDAGRQYRYGARPDTMEQKRVTIDEIEKEISLKTDIKTVTEKTSQINWSGHGRFVPLR